MQPTQRDQGKCSLSTIVALHTGHQYTWQRSCLSRHSMHRHTCRHRKTRDGIIPQCILKRPWLKHTSEIKPSGIGVARNNSGTLIRHSPIWLCHSWPKLEYISLFWEAVQSVSMRIDYEVINKPKILQSLTRNSNFSLNAIFSFDLKSSANESHNLPAA